MGLWGRSREAPAAIGGNDPRSDGVSFRSGRNDTSDGRAGIISHRSLFSVFPSRGWDSMALNLPGLTLVVDEPSHVPLISLVRGGTSPARFLFSLSHPFTLRSTSQRIGNPFPAHVGSFRR